MLRFTAYQGRAYSDANLFFTSFAIGECGIPMELAARIGSREQEMVPGMKRADHKE
jgi:hypothetical protein